jgi:subtilisin family serine protease
LESSLVGRSESDVVKVLVVMRERADIATLDRNLHAAKAPLGARHAQVVTALQDVARGSQGSLLSDLETRRADKAAGGIRGYTSHWIINAVVVEATVAAVRELALRDDVEVVEADLEVELIEPVSVKTGVPRPSPDKSGFVAPGVIAIGARRVWNELGITGEGTLVANMDSGVDGEHPALAARWQGNFAPVRSAWRDIAGTGARYFPADYHGHGTHTMGTITGATAFDTLGVAPGARWIANNAINSEFEGYDNKIIAGFEFTADPDGNPATQNDVPDVMHNSWGVRVGYGYVACDSRWWDAIDHCEAAGVVVTFSAGNEGPMPMSLRSPGDRASSPTSCFTIGSTAKEAPFQISDFSSRGPSACGGVDAIKPEVMAPGDDIYSTFPGGGYAYMSGTSMAGPHVAGVVALMRQAAPDLDVIAIKEILMATAVDLGDEGEDNDYGHGFIDAYAAVSLVMNNTGTVAGNVVDDATGQPVVGAIVRDLRGTTQRETPTNGSFRFTVLSGATDLRVSKFGYPTLEVPVTVPVLEAVDVQTRLVAMPPAMIEGIVRGPDGQPLEGATVTALDTPVPSAVTNWMGYYRLVLPSGLGQVYELLAVAPDMAYVSQSVGLENDRTVDLALPVLRADGFESGDFSALPWQRTGQVLWTTTDLQPGDGARSARSGAIAHGGASTLTVSHHVGLAGTMSFRYRTDSEITYDALKFYVDNQLQGTWSGSVPWTQFSLELPAGPHTLKWEYRKDSSVSIGEDAVWIDQVALPGTGLAPAPSLEFSFAPVTLEMGPTATATRPMTIRNVGNAPLTYTVTILGSDIGWCTVQPASGTVQPYNTANVTVAINAAQAALGSQAAVLQVATNDAAQATSYTPVSLTVLAAAPVGSDVPLELTLFGAVPNPFNPSTEIVFALPAAGQVRVRLYDVSGRLVRVLADGSLPAGENRLRWDGNDDRGRALASGVYYLRVESADAVKGAALSLVR